MRAHLREFQNAIRVSRPGAALQLASSRRAGSLPLEPEGGRRVLLADFGEERVAGVLANTYRPAQGRALVSSGRDSIWTVSNVARSRSGAPDLLLVGAARAPARATGSAGTSHLIGRRGWTHH